MDDDDPISFSDKLAQRRHDAAYDMAYHIISDRLMDGWLPPVANREMTVEEAAQEIASAMVRDRFEQGWHMALSEVVRLRLVAPDKLDAVNELSKSPLPPGDYPNCFACGAPLDLKR
jgi:hypothetical protein